MSKKVSTLLDKEAMDKEAMDKEAMDKEISNIKATSSTPASSPTYLPEGQQHIC